MMGIALPTFFTDRPISLTFHAFGPILFGVLIIVVLFIHECIHALFFKVYKREAKVKLGFKNGMAYATSPGAIYPRNQFLVIILMPFVIISLGLAGAYLLGVNGVAVYLMFAIHTSGCIGDFYYCYLLSKYDSDIYVEDTAEGINLYKKKD